jgi:hypothetical protein
MDFKIVDNFLNKTDFEKLQDILLGSHIPWFQNKYIVNHALLSNAEKSDLASYYDYQFTHAFYRNYTICSEFFQVLDPILIKLNPSAILKIKANLIPRADKIVEHQLHTDILNFKGKTSVFYLNSNDGYTLFQNGERVHSVANRMVIFDSNIMHTGTTCTNAKNRCVINFNFYNWDVT